MSDGECQPRREGTRPGCHGLVMAPIGTAAPVYCAPACAESADEEYAAPRSVSSICGRCSNAVGTGWRRSAAGTLARQRDPSRLPVRR